MALQLILGNSGGGKTRYIQEKIIAEAEENPKRKYLMIVPEQFTMQTQKELVRLHPRHSIMNIDILSFERLAYRIFDELGTFSGKVLEETGKNLILRKIAEEKTDELVLLGSNMTKMGYITEVKSLISELSQYSVTPKQLNELTETLPEGSFSSKLKDVSVMYRGFLDFLEGRFVTAEEILELLIEAADRSKILAESVICFDGYTGFTPIQNRLIDKLLTIAERIYVTVTIDTRENPYHCTGMHELFAMSKKTIGTLIKMADNRHVTVETPILLEYASANEKNRFSHSEELFFLEQNLFRAGKKQMYPKKEIKDIQIASLQNPRAELHHTAVEIERLVREKGFRYKDIAIVCGDLTAYANYALEVFSDYEIPLFIDRKTTILYHPFTEFLRAVIEVMIYDFSYESMFRYFRSGLSNISQEETDILENYVLAAGIRGHKKWTERFCYIPKGYEEEELEEINAIRERAITPLDEMRTSFHGKNLTVTEQTTALYQLIQTLKIQEKLKKKEEVYKARGDLKNAGEYAQIYQIVMDLFDKMTELLGDEKIPTEEYAKILDAGFEAAKVGVLPAGYDRVVLGDIERTRLNDIKALFFVGVNDGMIPKTGGADGILSQLERDYFSEQKIELAPSVREQAFIQKFYLYLNLTKPSEKLYVSYARVDGEGKTLRSSYLVSVIAGMYENLKVREIEAEEYKERIVTPKNSLALFVEGLEYASEWKREGKENEQKLWGALCKWYEKEPQWSKKAYDLIRAAELKHNNTPISAAVSRMLYGTVLENSVTRLEKFAACAFAHFLSYGLELKERNLNSFESTDIGNIFHEVLQIYAEKLKENGYNWFEITEEESGQLLSAAMEQAIGENHNLALYENARSSYAKERMFRILKRTVWALTKQVRQGRFEPEGFEVSFSYANDFESVKFQLSEEEKMHLRGRIDRIDTLEQDGKLYVKVIDYKSGNTSFQFLNIYYGLQLQLVVYMNAALELMEKKHKDKEVVPAGIFYYHVKDPVIEENGMVSEEELQQKILKELKLNGLVNGDRQVLGGMDKELDGASAVSSSVIPAGINKDGSLKKTSKTMDTNEFAALSSYVNETIFHLGERIFAGDIDVSPYSLDGKTGCDYCEYASVCQFDKKLGFRYRTLDGLSEEEAVRRMKGGA